MPLLSNSLQYKGPLTQLAPHSIFTGLWTSLPYWCWWFLLASTSLGYMACIHGILGVIAYNIYSDYIRMYIYSRSFKMWFLARWMSCSSQSNSATFGIQWFACNMAQLWTPPGDFGVSVAVSTRGSTYEAIIRI